MADMASIARSGQIPSSKKSPQNTSKTERGAFAKDIEAFRWGAAIAFVCGCLGTVFLIVIYHLNSVSVPAFYFVARPAFVWFSGLIPFLCLGFFGVKLRWVLAAAVIWIGGLVATEDVLQMVKPFLGNGHEEFIAAKATYDSFQEVQGASSGNIDVPLRIVTWNVATGNRGTHELVNQLMGLEPDIAFLQEFFETDLAEAVAENPAFANYNRAGGRTTLLSRYPVRRLPNVSLPGRLGSVWEVEVSPGKTVTCINVHLSPRDLRTQLLRGWTWQMLENGKNRTERELQQVESTIAHYSKSGPVVLAGDFNLPPEYPYVRRATRGLKDCFAVNGYGWGKTAPTKLPVVRIDMIFVPKEATVYYSRAVPTEFSDHYMTLAEVAIKPAAKSESKPEESKENSPGAAQSFRESPDCALPCFYRAGTALPLGQKSAALALVNGGRWHLQ